MPPAEVSRYWMLLSAMRMPTRLVEECGTGVIVSMVPTPTRSGPGAFGTTTAVPPAPACGTTTVPAAGAGVTTAGGGATTTGAGAGVTLSCVTHAVSTARARGARTSFFMGISYRWQEASNSRSQVSSSRGGTTDGAFARGRPDVAFRCCGQRGLAGQADHHDRRL